MLSWTDVVGATSTTAPSTWASRPTGLPITTSSSVHGHAVAGGVDVLPDRASSITSGTRASRGSVSLPERATTCRLAFVTSTDPPYTWA